MTSSAGSGAQSTDTATGQAAGPPAPPDRSAEIQAQIQAESQAGLKAEIDKLVADLAARQSEYDAVADSLDVRDARIAVLTAALAQREAELADLRRELADLRERLAFDIQLATMKRAEPTDASGPVGTDDPDAILAAAGIAADETATTDVERILTDIQFDFGSSLLTPGGRTHAAVAASMLADMDLAAIRLVGYTDRSGSPEANRALAAARAHAVADFLMSLGLPETLIETAGMGESDAPVETDDGVREPLNRLVTIIALPRPAT